MSQGIYIVTTIERLRREDNCMAMDEGVHLVIEDRGQPLGDRRERTTTWW